MALDAHITLTKKEVVTNDTQCKHTNHLCISCFPTQAAPEWNQQETRPVLLPFPIEVSGPQ